MFTGTDTGKTFQKGKHAFGSRHKTWAAIWPIYSIKIQCTCMQNKCKSSNNNKQIPKQKQNSIVLWHLDDISLKAIVHDDMIDGVYLDYSLPMIEKWYGFISAVLIQIEQEDKSTTVCNFCDSSFKYYTGQWIKKFYVCISYEKTQYNFAPTMLFRVMVHKLVHFPNTQDTGFQTQIQSK